MIKQISFILVIIAVFIINVYAVDDGGRCSQCGKLTLKGASHVCRPKNKSGESGRSGSIRSSTSRKINIKGFCGHEFHEKNTNDLMIVRCKSDKTYFGGYDRLEMKYSKHAGLYSISAFNDDSYSIKDVEKEILRMISIFEKKFRVKFSRDISYGSNAVYENVLDNVPVTDSVTKGISCYRLQRRDIMTKPATVKKYGVRETFDNAVIEFYGNHDLTDGSMFVRCTVEIRRVDD